MKTTRRQQAAEMIGDDENTIGAAYVQLKQLRQLGLLIDIDVRGVSMFSASATFAEWGIADADAESKDRLSGGMEYLIPKVYVKQIRSIESGARQLLDDYAVKNITGFAPRRWMPFTAYPTWKAKHEQKAAELEGVKRDIIRKYDELKTLAAADFAKIARRAWRSITAHGYDAILVKGRAFEDEDEFVGHVVSRAMLKFPAKADIKKNMRLEYYTSILEDDADVAQRLLDEERTQSEREALRRSSEWADAEAQARLESMQQAELERARRQLAEMGSPLDEVVNALRSRLKTDVQSILAGVQKNGFLRGKVAEKGAGLLELYDLMSVANDWELRNKLAALRTAIGPIGDERAKDAPERDVAEIKAVLEDIVELASTQAAGMAVNGRFSALEV